MWWKSQFDGNPVHLGKFCFLTKTYFGLLFLHKAIITTVVFLMGVGTVDSPTVYFGTSIDRILYKYGFETGDSESGLLGYLLGFVSDPLWS